MTYSLIQNSFTSGEVSPSLFGRTDTKGFHNGAFTMRNFFSNFRGGAASRAGFSYTGTSKQAASVNSTPPRLITFQFNINQGYALEFGDQYMRIIYRDAYITESTKTITGITKANPGVFTSNAHGYSNGDWVDISSVVGMTNFNGLTWIVQNVTANTFTVTDLFGNAINTTSFTAYSSGGTAARIYTVVSPYAAIDLPYLKYTQSADTMSLTCWNQSTLTEYPIYDLQRLGNTNWVFTATSFGSSISAPRNVAVTAESSTTTDTYYSYVVTAIDSVTGQESIASSPGGVKNNDIAINAGSNNISWTGVTGASSYNIYASVPSYSVPVPTGVSYGLIGSSFSTNFIDTNIIADFTKSPPLHQNPFARGQITSVNVTAGGAGFSQSTIAYSITTSTGTGFVGVSIVVNGALAAFVVQNNGSGYLSTDTITITGGGVAASGTYTFTGNPTNGQNIVLNGVTWTFTTGVPTTAQTKIGANTAVTLSTLALNLNASENASINVASYSASATVLTITYNTTGTGGNAYTLAVGTYGGAVSAATLAGGVNGSDLGATATLTVGPQTGTYPGDVAYFQQRRVYSDTQNAPDTYFMSQPGNYTNFDSSVPVVDSDSITGKPWAQQINGIQFMVPMPNGLIVLTGLGAWLLNGFGNSAITPSNQQAQAQAYNGCTAIVPPIVINYNILYVQAKGSIVRDLAFNFYANVYTGTDTTVLSNHLFNFFQIIQWAYAEEPYRLVWAVRNDGSMLSLTYLKEQEVNAWARHDTNGFFVSVCSVVEPPVDAVYVVVKRYIIGQSKWMYYIERMDNRNWIHAEDCFCVDAGLQYPMTYPAATLTPAAANGTDNISSVNIITGGSGYTAPVITALDSTGSGTGATFTATLSGGVITGVTVNTQGVNYTAGFTTLVITDATGSGAILQPVITNIVSFTASSSVFNSGMVGDVIRIGNNNATVTSGISTNGGGQATITSYVSGTQVMANITAPILDVITDDPNFTPVPALSGQWSISVPVTTVGGLNHLEGMEVAILADGSVITNQTVSNGQITLPQAASSITIGLPYICQLQTAYLEPPSQMTVQGARKNIYSAIIRVESSRGLEVGTNQVDASTQEFSQNVPWTNMIPIKDQANLVTSGNQYPLLTKDEFINLPASWDVHGQVAVQQLFPLPANVNGIVFRYVLGDTSDR